VVLVARECERSATEDVLLRAAFTHATVVGGMYRAAESVDAQRIRLRERGGEGGGRKMIMSCQ
jgi:hypothetical protein